MTHGDPPCCIRCPSAHPLVAFAGYFISATLIVWSGSALALTLLVLAMLRLEAFFPTLGSMLDVQYSYGSTSAQPLPNLGTAGGSSVLGAEFLFQVGFLMMLPLFCEEAVEFGLRHAFSSQIRQQLSLRMFFTFFQERTKAAFYDRALQLAEAKYVATGRSFDGMTVSFTYLWQAYARTHFMYAAELATALGAYAFYSRLYRQFPSTELSVYWINTFPLWLLVGACALSPWAFNPSTFSSLSLRQHFHAFLVWVDEDPMHESWQQWNDAHMARARDLPCLRRTSFYVTRVFPRRAILILAAMGALEPNELPPASTPFPRETLSLAVGGVAIFSAILLFFIVDSGSSRTLFGMGAHDADGEKGTAPERKRVWLRFGFCWGLRTIAVAAFTGVVLLYAKAYVPTTQVSALRRPSDDCPRVPGVSPVMTHNPPRYPPRSATSSPSCSRAGCGSRCSRASSPSSR